MWLGVPALPRPALLCVLCCRGHGVSGHRKQGLTPGGQTRRRGGWEGRGWLAARHWLWRRHSCGGQGLGQSGPPRVTHQPTVGRGSSSWTVCLVARGSWLLLLPPRPPLGAPLESEPRPETPELPLGQTQSFRLLYWQGRWPGHCPAPTRAPAALTPWPLEPWEVWGHLGPGPSGTSVRKEP